MRMLFLLLAMPLLLAAAPPKRPQRIVSLNLCADQYLLALADPGQIAALTRFARDPQMSAEAEKAAHVPISRGSAEEVLALRPDLIIASPFRRRETMAQLRGREIATVDLPSAESYADIVAQVRQIAAAVGYPERGEALVAQMDRRLAAVPRDGGAGATAAYYQRRGYLTGTGTLVDEMLRRVGLRNLAERLGKPSLARIGLEEMARARPDYLIVESASEHVIDQGTEMLHHPILADIPRIRIPQAWTVCGGPAYADAVASLSAQLKPGR
ncbi:ABC transporter substrate-binding protein [Sandaracinobacter sp. RS1-74]|uniref:ABC transporter substrate-binding protein n=1 Tax=Sandaracinobacteroides sayramensis TaxID=2913411 RepID=UPI001EDC7598|nr:ABC transporter substrate-binding protein [Sandaracinobacteroides sayramensis]MCG2841611.1 ABC transporter substrate-binding protein [Sandaracinobacteroides sayramensis]